MSFGVMIDPSASGGGSPEKDKSTIQQAIEKFYELIDVQAKVDEAIASLPSGSDKDRLIAEKNKNRGFFQNVVIPTWNRLRDLIGYKPASANTLKGYEDDTMGVPPVAIWAASALASSVAVALLGYIGNSIYVENKILNDPALTGAQKLKALESRGLANIFSNLTSTLTMLGVVGGGVFLAYLYLKGQKLGQR